MRARSIHGPHPLSTQHRATNEHPSAPSISSLSHLSIDDSLKFQRKMPLAGIITHTNNSSTRVRRRGHVPHAQSHGKNASIRVRPAGDKDIVLPGSAAYIGCDLPISLLTLSVMWFSEIFCHQARKTQNMQDCMA
jgi:hypothetical protein